MGWRSHLTPLATVLADPICHTWVLHVIHVLFSIFFSFYLLVPSFSLHVPLPPPPWLFSTVLLPGLADGWRWSLHGHLVDLQRAEQRSPCCTEAQATARPDDGQSRSSSMPQPRDSPAWLRARARPTANEAELGPGRPMARPHDGAELKP